MEWKKGVKLKCSIDKKTPLFQFFANNAFLPICNNFSEQNYLDRTKF